MASKFLAKYFPPAKSAQPKIEITTFKQQDYELLYEAWERYKELLRKCPNHNFPDWEQIELFYNGLNGPTRISIDAAAGGSIFSKFPEQTYEILELMTLAALTKGNQSSTETTSLVTAANSADGFESNVLNPPPGFNTQNSKGKASLEDLVSNFIAESSTRFKRNENSFDSMETHLNNVSASMKNLKTQIVQLANALNNQQRGVFPSNTEVNPREQCKDATLRSGKELGSDNPKAVYDEEVEEIVVESENSDRKNSSKSAVVPEKPPKIHINIPFADALEQMPHYDKFMKDVMARKRKIEVFETVKLTEECSAILQKKLPQKLKDPGSFTISCIIGGANVNRALRDLGARLELEDALARCLINSINQFDGDDWELREQFLALESLPKEKYGQDKIEALPEEANK
ncbi:uncharacterized protein [Henckelia pumila]|uniref:uncharacterized protein n=1 Tax=Henckelia pumila TaxID=405737 RepID=UPI003C6DD5F9